MLDAPQVSPGPVGKALAHSLDPVIGSTPAVAWYSLRLFGAGRRPGDFDRGIELPGREF